MFQLKTPAKINWFLHVIGKRDDGYHEIASLIQPVSLFDTLEFKLSDTLQVICDAGIAQEENLVYRAASLMKGRMGVASGATITLKKDIPMQAGLGGGSSDAACTITGLNRLWGLNLDNDKMLGLAAEIGSDVPFFIGSEPALVEGRGERLSPFPLELSCEIVLVKPSFGISTAWAYSKIDPNKLTKHNININNMKIFFDSTCSGERTSSTDGILINDLETVVSDVYPEVVDIKEKLKSNGAFVALMSGSGSAVFGAFNDREAARRAVEALSAEYWCRAVRTLP